MNKKPKKILFLVDSYSLVCGVSKHIRTLVKGLTLQDKYVIFIIAGRINYKEGLEYENVVLIENPDLYHADRNITGFVRSIFFIRRFIGENNIDIIHSHHHYEANIAWLASRFTNAMAVFTNHGILPDKGILGHFRGDEIIAVNKHAAEYISKKIQPEKVHLIRNGVIDYNLPRHENGRIVIAASSRFVPEKGLDVFIKAISKMKLREQADFIIIGEGAEKDKLLALNNELSTQVKFHDPVEDLQKFLGTTNIFVYPSRSGEEGFPITLVEAAYSGNLIITSDFRGVRNILDSDEYGFVFPVDDIDALTSLMDYSIENYSLTVQKAEAFQKKCKVLFSIDTMIDKIDELYSSI